MRRFLVALLIAVAAGTDHFADPVAANPNPVAANPNPDPVADGACEGWCNQYTCESAACETCDICQTVFEGNFCASWCNDYTCGGTTTPPVELCGGCEACQFLFIGDGTRCLPWCNSYTCGQDDCAACNGILGSPNCLDPLTFCEDWCSSWTCDSPYCVGCPSCEIVDEIKGCTCKNTWADEGCDDPQATQAGCTNCDQDEAGSWCIVDEAPCAGSEDGGDWFYCDPDFSPPPPTPMPPPASCAWAGTDANEQLLKGYDYCEDTPVGSAARGAACLECCDPGANKENNDWQADCAFAAGVPFGRVYDASYASANCAPSSWCKSKECSTKGGSIAMLRMCDATLKDQLRDSPEGGTTASSACAAASHAINELGLPLDASAEEHYEGLRRGASTFEREAILSALRLMLQSPSPHATSS